MSRKTADPKRRPSQNRTGTVNLSPRVTSGIKGGQRIMEKYDASSKG